MKEFNKASHSDANKRRPKKQAATFWTRAGGVSSIKI